MQVIPVSRLLPALAVLVAAAGCRPADQPPESRAESPPPAEPAADDGVTRRTGGSKGPPAFRAVGQEPGWLLYIVPGRWIDFRYDYGEQRVHTPVPEGSGEGGTTSYVAETDAHKLGVTIEDTGCQDAMSGDEYPATVTVELDGRRFSGCGETLTANVAPGRYCYRNVTPPGGDPAASDVQSLAVDVVGAWAEGEYDWLPAEKDARRGRFEGVLDGDTVDALYEFAQEGRQDEAAISIRLGRNAASVSGGAPELGLAATMPREDCV